MKKILALFLVFVFIFSMSGCGVKKKIENKIGEAIGEKIIEGAIGQKVDVDGDQVTLEGDDGSKFTIGGGEWPKNDLIKNIPEFKGGKIESVMSGEEATVISIDDVDKNAFENYLNNIKNDFTKDAYELNSDEFISYTGMNDKNVQIQLTYDIEGKSMSLAIAQK
ncbi:MAG: hypothetical protein ACOX2A_05995 [Tepidanaerobacteraceae bacterium]|jgi:hypothetical protein|nr:hypothetical protein [Thermoanaerobacterales bacterium]